MTTEVRFSCRGCKAPASLEVREATAQYRCEACGRQETLRFSESLRNHRIADRCALCDSEHFYVQKDFNQGVGCLIVAIGAVLVPWTYGLSLGVCALIDLVLYRKLPNVAKCYVCKAVYRGGQRNPAHEAFDLHLLEKYEAEARKKEAADPGSARNGEETPNELQD